MQRQRRHLMLQGLGIATTGLVGLPMAALAQTDRADAFPSRPVTLVVPAPAGGATDALARTLADIMGKSLGQPFVIDNKPGASGMLATQAVARARPDGHTLLMTFTTPIYYAPYMFSKMAYDPRRDLAFITHVCDANLVLAVNKDVPAASMKQFVAWAGANKGKVVYGSYGIGTGGHLMSSYLSEQLGLDMIHAPYKGEAPMVQDLVGGQIPWAIGTVGTMGPHIASGRLRALAIVGDQRIDSLPGVPTMAQAGFPDKEYKPVGGFVMMAPSGVPAPVLKRLEGEARAAVQNAQMKARFQVYGLVAVGNSAVDARKAFDDSGPVIEKLVKISGATMD